MAQTTLIATLYILILFLIGLVFYKLLNRKPDEPNEQTSVIMDDIKNGYTRQEINDFLEWQFKLGIIDSIEYNEMVLKCLPYAKINHP
jgi:ABC-type antimicrobial peptide transport system permease subunit